MNQDIVELRRGDHSGARLCMERERLERETEKSEEEVLEHFKRWAMRAEVRDWICQNWISPEERERRIREIFGLPPRAPNASADEADSIQANPTESNQIQTLQTRLSGAEESQ